MGIMDSLEQMAAQCMTQSGGTSAHVAGDLMQALDEHPGGLAGVISSLQQNGLGEHVQNWASGAQATATPEQVQQGLQGTGLIDIVAAKANISPEMAKAGLAIVLPMVIAHFTQNGQQQAPASGFSGMASQILGKFL